MDTVDVGATLRAARESAGLSLSAMASRTHYSRGYLANVENGRKRATPDMILSYERALGDDMQRRTLLTGLAASIVAPAVMNEALSGAYSAALSGRSVSVEEWRWRAEQYGREYMSLGAGELSNRLVADMVQLQQHTASDPHTWAPAARLMTVYGKTLPGNDGRKGAVHWYRLAALAADRSGDLPTRVWVRGRAALALAYEAAAPGVSRQLAGEALALSEDHPSLGRLNALVAQAHVAGAAGDRDGALATLDQARRLFDEVGSHEQVSDFAVPEWRWHTFESMLLSRLGDPRATDVQDAADRSRPAELTRFATHIELHRGLFLAREGDHAGGVEYAQAALDRLPPDRRSLSLRLMMDEIDQTSTQA